MNRKCSQFLVILSLFLTITTGVLALLVSLRSTVVTAIISVFSLLLLFTVLKTETYGPPKWLDTSYKWWGLKSEAELDAIFCLSLTVHVKGLYHACMDTRQREKVYRSCKTALKEYVGLHSVQCTHYNEFLIFKRFPPNICSRERDKIAHQETVCRNLYQYLNTHMKIGNEVDVSIGSASSGMRYHINSIDQLIDLAYVTQCKAHSDHQKWLVADEHIRARKLDIDECREGFFKEGWEEEFNPFYQPIVEPDTFTVIGSESLARWQLGGFRILPAKVFKDVAEELHHITTIDWIIISKTFSCIRSMMLERLLPYSFTVVLNLSNESLTAGFADQVLFLANQSGLPPSQIEFDLTDSAFSESEALSTIRELRRMGFKISLDIFEETSFDLQVFAQGNFDTIKLDFTAFTPLLEKIYASLIEAAHQKGVVVVAKGVENREVLTAAINLGCDYVQGNYFTLPIPEQTFKIFVNKYQEGLYVDSLG